MPKNLWKKGQSGNPKGRPRTGTSLAERVRKTCGQDGGKLIDMLEGVALGSHRDTASRLKAAAILLERGYGSPPKDFTLNLGEDGPKKVKFILERK